jgi:HEPN domain-containing protein
MAYGITRLDLRALAQAKLDDATVLFQNTRVSNAYYLAGYAVELGLKACIASQVSAETIPDKEFLKKVLNHDFRTLIGLAGLLTALQEAQDKDPAFAANWAIVSEWSPDARYETKDTMLTQVFLTAMSDPKSGVFQWIKQYW